MWRSYSGSVRFSVRSPIGRQCCREPGSSLYASTLAVTRRSYDPYGNPRGTKPSTWVSADENHGFLGQPADSVTGLNLLGARNYDPTLGRFLTPDPLFQAGDPNQMGGYTYAADNPASSSDPTGYDDWANTSMNTCAPGFTCGSPTPSPSPAPAPAPTSTSSGSSSSPSSTVPAAQELPHANPNEKIDPHGAAAVLDSIITAPFHVANCTFWLSGAGAGHDESCEIAGGVVSGGGLEGGIAGAAERGAAGDLEGAAEGAVEGDAAAAVGAGAKAVDEAAADAADLVAMKRANAQARAREADAEAAKPSSPGSGSSGTKPARSGTPSKCSFSPDTPVLMAKGKTKPIGKIKAGDKVEAADPKTGKHQGTHRVTATWANLDTDLVDLTVRTADGSTFTLHTTSRHPFWDRTTRRWVPAGEFRVGHALTTKDDQVAYVTDVHGTPGSAERYNLTVDRLHTYYVLAGTTPVLVHNTCGEEGDYLYRGLPKGISGEHPAYRDALQGRAVPKGGHSDPARHAGGNTDSEFTSWTHDYEGVALDAAEEFGVEHGLVMRIPRESIPEDIDFQIHGTDRETYEEMEHSLLGTVEGAEISIGRGPWTRPGG